MNQSNIIKQAKFTYYLLGKHPKTTGSKIEVINKKKLNHSNTNRKYLD